MMMQASVVVGALVLGAQVQAGARLDTNTSTNARVERAPLESTASTGPTASGDGSIRVLVDPSIDDASLLPVWVLERNPEVGATLRLPGHEQWVAVEIAGETYAYELTVRPMRDGAVLGDRPEPWTCECNTKELLDRLDEEVAGAVEVLRTTPAADAELEADPAPPPPPRRWAEPTALGIAGIAVGGVGVASVVGGAVAFAKERAGVSSLGAGLVSGGVVALLSGTTMLMIDLSRCRRRPESRGCRPDALEPSATSASTRRPRVELAASTRAVMLSISGRF